ncbi:alpha/beta hydrolase family protein [Streptomyces humi]|uniref:alpha/beta hydrolase family protein n=1 Tax=Streptomyces humi TaxID=1428620 RepID=UPI0006999D14|nr:alpha/beta fold hydrolase [Streptomyces humi]
MPHRTRRRTLTALAALLLAASLTPTARAAEAVRVEGTLPSGAAYVIDMPDSWNGTVLLYSHGYTPVGVPNPARDAPDDATKSLLMKQGYALTGSSYATAGWAVADAVPDQLATLDAFTGRFGAARRTLAWGTSYGGLVTTMIAERHPDRVSGTLSMCGLVQGGVATWNSMLDTAFALRTLLGGTGSDIRLTGLRDTADAAAQAAAMTELVERAQTTATGRARIALAAALYDVPGWNDDAVPRPAPADWDAQQAGQYRAVVGLIGLPAFVWRQEAERRAGGNMSWNTGVDYPAMLRKSPNSKEVSELYREAGRSLRTDLGDLNRAARVVADRQAVDWMDRTSVFTGRLRGPQLDIHTTGDPLIPVQAESAHRRAATAAGSAALLRQGYVGNAGHCTFSPGEQVAALHTLEDRIASGHWRGADPASLNARARAADPASAARYTPYEPGPYPRPYDLAHPRDRQRSPGHAGRRTSPGWP